MTRLLRTGAIAVAVGAAGSTLAAWQDDDGIDPKAERILQEASDYLRGLASFELTIAVNLDIQTEGMRQWRTNLIHREMSDDSLNFSFGHGRYIVGHYH